MIYDAIQLLGRTTINFIKHLGNIAVFFADIIIATLNPPLRMRQFLDEVYKLGVLSIVIICVCGLAVGMVLGLQGYNTLVRFGAEEALGAVVGLSLVRELGPLLTALLATGLVPDFGTCQRGPRSEARQGAVPPP